MAYKINEDCISCGACESACKNEAIKEGETLYEIEAAKCTECVGWFDSPQCVDTCPVDSCVLDEDNKESKEQLLEKWKKLNPGKKPEA
ncbi:YfhL family 4Fe-4S dicluster ferredoxin [Chloroflexota bacterium]